MVTLKYQNVLKVLEVQYCVISGIQRTASLLLRLSGFVWDNENLENTLDKMLSEGL